MKKFLFLALSLLTLTTPTFAHAGEFFAYLDPGTGSLVLQVIAMGFLSVLAFFSQLKTLVLGWLTRQKSGNATAENSPSTIPMQSVNSETSHEDQKAA